MPIAFNVIESANCDEARTRRVIAKIGSQYNGYIYPMASCEKEKEQLIVSDFQGTVERTLPLCQGYKMVTDEEGCRHVEPYTYGQYVDEKILPLADNGPLSTLSKLKYRIGLDYYQAKTTLPPDSPEC